MKNKRWFYDFQHEGLAQRDERLHAGTAAHVQDRLARLARRKLSQGEGVGPDGHHSVLGAPKLTRLQVLIYRGRKFSVMRRRGAAVNKQSLELAGARLQRQLFSRSVNAR